MKLVSPSSWLSGGLSTGRSVCISKHWNCATRTAPTTATTSTKSMLKTVLKCLFCFQIKGIYEVIPHRCLPPQLFCLVGLGLIRPRMGIGMSFTRCFCTEMELFPGNWEKHGTQSLYGPLWLDGMTCLGSCLRWLPVFCSTKSSMLGRTVDRRLGGWMLKPT